MTESAPSRAEGRAATAPRVSCVMIFLDGAAFIDEAIRSVVGQQGFDQWELLLIDDGSTDHSTDIAKRWADGDPRIRYLHHDGHENRGMSASRNLGIEHARGEFISFLDCDDVWLPDKLRAQVTHLDEHPEVDATYGPTLVWYSWTGAHADIIRDHLSPVGVRAGTVLRPPETLRLYRRTGGAVVPAICSVLVRRTALVAVGGFDDAFRGSFEDQVFYTKMGLHMTVLVTGECHDRYRQHDDSACARGMDDRSYHPEAPNRTEELFLLWLERYLEDLDMRGDEAWQDVQRALEVYRVPSGLAQLTNARWRRTTWLRMKLRAKRVLPSSVYSWMRYRRGKRQGHVRLRELRRVEPLFRTPADTRGTPVEDALAATFLTEQQPLLRGRVLAVGSAAQVRDLVDHAVADVDAVPASVLDGARPSSRSATADRYDCVVALGVLQSVHDPAASLRWLHSQLSTGGTLLLTVPGLVQRQEHDRAPARWGFADETLREMAEEVFGSGSVQVETEGNALTAIAVVHGLPAEQFTDREIRHRDDDIPVLLTLRATCATAVT